MTQSLCTKNHSHEYYLDCVKIDFRAMSKIWFVLKSQTRAMSWRVLFSQTRAVCTIWTPCSISTEVNEKDHMF